MAIAYVNGSHLDEVSGVAAGSASAPAINAVTGNFIVVGTRGVNITGVADTAGNTYTKIAYYAGAGSTNITFWYAYNITGNASNIVTATFASNTGYYNIAVAQYSGIRTASDPLDVYDTAQATGTSVTSGAFTTTNANDLIICYAANNSIAGTNSAGAGFTLRSAGALATFQEKIVSSIQTGATVSISNSSSVGWAFATMTFKDPAASNHFLLSLGVGQ
jgi:hypothetical protein